MTGSWPNGFLDHKNGVRSDNRWHNLRIANKSQNAANSKTNIRNRLGLKGVVAVVPEGSRFKANIKKNGKKKHLGVFATPEEAHAAYCKAAKEVYGEFSRTE